MTKLSELPDGWSVAVDTETSGLHLDDGARLSIVSYAFRDPDGGKLCANALPFDQGVLSLPLGDKDIPARHVKRLAKWDERYQREVAPNLEPERYCDLIDVLSRLNLIYQNAKFDMHMLRAGPRKPVDAGVYPFFDLEESFGWDTFLASNVIFPQFPTGLKPTAVRLELTGGGEDESQKALAPFLGPMSSKLAYPDGPRFDLIPWSVIKPYATDDAINTLLLSEWQARHLGQAPHLWPLYRNDARLMKCLYWMEQRGIKYDGKISRTMTKWLATEQATVAKTFPFKATPPGAKKFFFLDAGRKPYPDKRTLTCRKSHPSNCVDCPQLDTEVQQRLVDEGVEWAKEYQFHENLKSARTKWYEPWGERVGPDGRLRASFRQAKVVTERLSAERANLLAIPRDDHMPPVEGLIPVSKLFSAKLGHELWYVDVSQAEVRVGAAIAECHTLLDGFRAGIDAHSQVTMRIFEIDAENPEWKMHRQIGKTLNLQLQYGSGVRRVKAELDKETGRKWPLKKVKTFVDDWHAAVPEMSRAMDESKHQAETLGWVRLWNGRQRWLAHQRGGPADPPWSAFNAKCQGGVAEIMKLVMWKWEQEYPGTMLLQIHDALVLELPAQGPWIEKMDGGYSLTAADVAADCAELMVDEFETAMMKTWKGDDRLTLMPFEANIERFA